MSPKHSLSASGSGISRSGSDRSKDSSLSHIKLSKLPQSKQSTARGDGEESEVTVESTTHVGSGASGEEFKKLDFDTFSYRLEQLQEEHAAEVAALEQKVEEAVEKGNAMRDKIERTELIENEIFKIYQEFLDRSLTVHTFDSNTAEILANEKTEFKKSVAGEGVRILDLIEQLRANLRSLLQFKLDFENELRDQVHRRKMDCEQKLEDATKSLTSAVAARRKAEYERDEALAAKKDAEDSRDRFLKDTETLFAEMKQEYQHLVSTLDSREKEIDRLHGQLDNKDDLIYQKDLQLKKVPHLETEITKKEERHRFAMNQFRAHNNAMSQLIKHEESLILQIELQREGLEEKLKQTEVRMNSYKYDIGRTKLFETTKLLAEAHEELAQKREEARANRAREKLLNQRISTLTGALLRIESAATAVWEQCREAEGFSRNNSARLGLAPPVTQAVTLKDPDSPSATTGGSHNAAAVMSSFKTRLQMARRASGVNNVDSEYGLAKMTRRIVSEVLGPAENRVGASLQSIAEQQMSLLARSARPSSPSLSPPLSPAKSTSRSTAGGGGGDAKSTSGQSAVGGGGSVFLTDGGGVNSAESPRKGGGSPLRGGTAPSEGGNANGNNPGFIGKFRGAMMTALCTGDDAVHSGKWSHRPPALSVGAVEDPLALGPDLVLSDEAYYAPLFRKFIAFAKSRGHTPEESLFPQFNFGRQGTSTRPSSAAPHPSTSSLSLPRRPSTATGGPISSRRQQPPTYRSSAADTDRGGSPGRLPPGSPTTSQSGRRRSVAMAAGMASAFSEVERPNVPLPSESEDGGTAAIISEVMRQKDDMAILMNRIRQPRDITGLAEDALESPKSEPPSARSAVKEQEPPPRDPEEEEAKQEELLNAIQHNMHRASSQLGQMGSSSFIPPESRASLDLLFTPTLQLSRKQREELAKNFSVLTPDGNPFNTPKNLFTSEEKRRISSAKHGKQLPTGHAPSAFDKGTSKILTKIAKNGALAK